MADTESIRAFQARRWQEIAEEKAGYWAKEKMRRGADAAIRAGEALREEVRALRPDWPSEAERRADLDTHERVARGLAVAAPLRRR